MVWPTYHTRRHGAIGLLIFVLALAPRALAVGAFVTVDEGVHWFDRARAFLRAVETGAFADTVLTGHPGVTTMWLGALGELAARRFDVQDALLRQQLLRLPVALVTALCVALAEPLLRRLLGGRVALLAALLWAGSPFLVAHSQLLHLDALLASFMALALLAAMVAFGLGDTPQEQGSLRWPALIASAVAAGLALLTKAPAALLPPLVVVIAWAGYRRAPAERRALAAYARAVVAWCAIALAVWAGLWPAVWVDPLGALRTVAAEAVGRRRARSTPGASSPAVAPCSRSWRCSPC
jgi:hypothetical protein